MDSKKLRVRSAVHRKSQRVQLLLLGDLADEASPRGLLPLSDTLHVESAADLEAAEALLAAGALAPDVILLCESRPGEVSPEAIERMRQLAPLARMWRVLGSWNEGELRSGRPPTGCTRVYWHQFAPRLGQELERAARGEVPTWAQPLTATAEETVGQVVHSAGEDRSGLVVIVASQAETAAALAATLRRRGYATLLVNESQQWQAAKATAVIWDTAPDRLARSEFVRHLRASAAGAPLVALVTFPRVEDVRRARESGIGAVLSKPYQIGDLFWQIDRLSAAPLTSVARHA